MHREYKIPGGKLLVIDFEIRNKNLHEVSISGDFFIEPPESLDLINKALSGLPKNSSKLKILRTIQKAIQPQTILFGFSPSNIADLIWNTCNENSE